MWYWLLVPGLLYFVHVCDIDMFHSSTKAICVQYDIYKYIACVLGSGFVLLVSVFAIVPCLPIPYVLPSLLPAACSTQTGMHTFYTLCYTVQVQVDRKLMLCIHMLLRVLYCRSVSPYIKCSSRPKIASVNRTRSPRHPIGCLIFTLIISVASRISHNSSLISLSGLSGTLSML